MSILFSSRISQDKRYATSKHYSKFRVLPYEKVPYLKAAFNEGDPEVILTREKELTKKYTKQMYINNLKEKKKGNRITHGYL